MAAIPLGNDTVPEVNTTEMVPTATPMAPPTPSPDERDDRMPVAMDNEVSLTDGAEGVFMSQLAGMIHTDWQRNRENKRRVEDSMLECLRERKGEYSPEQMAAIKRTRSSDVYIKVATGKIRTAIAHIKAVMLPATGHPYGIDPTPKPDLPEWARNKITERILNNPQAVDAQGQPIAPDEQLDILTAMGQRALESHSRRAAKKMEALIADQLAEGGWAKEMDRFVDYFATYQAAFMKGPFITVQEKVRWEYGPQGIGPVKSLVPSMGFRAIDPFDAYPAPGVDSVHKGAFIERLRMSKNELYANRNLPGYDAEAIERVMMDNAQGHLDGWLWTDQIRAEIAEHSTPYYWYRNDADFDGLHWYSQVQGKVLIEHGMDPATIGDPMAFYEVDAILVGREVVRASLNRDILARRNIHSACYERVPGSVFGTSISMLMRSTTRVVNATARAMTDNVAISSSPQFEVNHRRVAPETPIHDIHPGKVWQTLESEMGTSGKPAINYFQPTLNSAALINVIEYFRKIADSDTGIPEMLQGGSPADGVQTARGQDRLLDATAKLLRSAIGNIDCVVTDILQLMFDWNMLNHPDNDVKGDCRIVARGANAILQRETIRSAALAALELTNNPEDRVLMGMKGRARLVSEVLSTYDGLDMSGVLPEGDELDQRIAELENAQQPPDPKLLAIEAENARHAEKMAVERERFGADAQVSASRDAADVEAARLRAQAEVDAATESGAARKVVAAIEAKNREDINEADLIASLKEITTKVRAERMDSREEALSRASLARMEAETKVRIEMMRRQEATATAEQPSPELPSAEIRQIVEAVLTPFASQLEGRMDQIAKEMTVSADVGQRTNPAPPITVNVEIPGPGSRTVRAERQPDGSILGTVTEGS